MIKKCVVCKSKDLNKEQSGGGVFYQCDECGAVFEGIQHHSGVEMLYDPRETHPEINFDKPEINFNKPEFILEPYF